MFNWAHLVYGGTFLTDGTQEVQATPAAVADALSKA